MPIPLEDNVGDIVGKAQRGLRVSDSQLAEKAGVRVEALDQLRGGQVDNDMLRKVAPILKLDPEALVELAAGKWKPDALENFDGLAQFTTDYSGMAVNEISAE